MPIQAPSVAHLATRARTTLLLLTAAFSLARVTYAVPPVVFRTPPAFPVGSGPWQVVAADFDGDGLPDMATVDFNVNTVSVLLGQGGGAFSSATSFVVGNHPDSLAVADVNGDGRADLVTANGEGWSGPGSVSVLLGRGDGTFEAAKTFATGQGPKGIVVGDFNGDQHSDIAIALSGGWRETNQVQVFFGHGDGTFEPPANYTVGWVPAWIATGDFNHDGHPDLVTANNGGFSQGNSVSVLLNQGDGTFYSATNYTVGSYPSSVLAVDFNADGNLDLAVAASFGASPAISVLLGRGDGTFGPATNLACPAGATQLSSGDYDRDGKVDLAVLGGDSNSGAVSLFRGSGTGGFSGPTVFNTSVGLQGICSADLTGDGRADIVGFGNAGVWASLNNGNGTFPR